MGRMPVRYVECPAEYHAGGTDLSLFLAGGITGCLDWHGEIVRLLSNSGLVLLNPRRAHWEMKPGAQEEQIRWEHAHLRRADAVLFWFPEETLCPIALYELGKWTVSRKKLFIGCHPNYQRREDVRIQTSLERPDQAVVGALAELAAQVLAWERGEVAGRSLAHVSDTGGSLG
jgi:hypothetical protein